MSSKNYFLLLQAIIAIGGIIGILGFAGVIGGN